MWQIEKREDGRYHSDPGANVWTAELPRLTLEDVRNNARRTRMKVRREGDVFRLTIPGTAPIDHPTLAEAMNAGSALHGEMEASLERQAFDASGLSPEAWEFKGWRFENRLDPSETVTPVGDAGWQGAIGSIRLPGCATGADAERAIASTPHLSFPTLERLEDVYDGTWGRRHPDRARDLVEAGLVVVDDEMKATLTAAGREALDADPRTVPIEVRETIFAQAVALVAVERDEKKREALGMPDLDAARYRLNRHLAGSNTTDNGLRLGQMLAERNVDVHIDWAETEPNEICVRMSGELNDGAYAHELTMLLLSPDWVEDGSYVLAEAVVNRFDELRRAYGMDMSNSPTP